MTRFPSAMLETRMEAAAARSRGRSARGAAAPSVVVLAGLVAGALTGVVLERAGVVDPVGEPAPVIVRIDSVSVLDCPDGVPVAALARGDRVVATGRSVDGDWLEIRSPVDLGGRAWVRSRVVTADPLTGGTDGLPVTECGPAETTTTPPSSTSTSTSTSTTTSSTTTTSTTVPTTTTTTAPNIGPLIATLTVTGRANGVEPPPSSTTTSTTSSTTTSTTLPTTTTTTLPVGSFQYVHVEANSGGCATVASVAVVVADPHGVASVRVDWSTGGDGASGFVDLAPVGGTEWRATLQFPATAVPAGAEFRVPAFSVTATDGLGLPQSRALAPTTSFRVYGADDLPCFR